MFTLFPWGSSEAPWCSKSQSTQDLLGQIPQRLQPKKLQQQQNCYLFIDEWAKERLNLFSIHSSANADRSFLLNLPPSRVTACSMADRLSLLFFGPQKGSQEGNFMLRQVPSSASEELLGGGRRPRRGRPARHPPAPPALWSNANVFRQGFPGRQHSGEDANFMQMEGNCVFMQRPLSLFQIAVCSRRSQSLSMRHSHSWPATQYALVTWSPAAAPFDLKPEQMWDLVCLKSILLTGWMRWRIVALVWNFKKLLKKKI